MYYVYTLVQYLFEFNVFQHILLHETGVVKARNRFFLRPLLFEVSRQVFCLLRSRQVFRLLRTHSGGCVCFMAERLFENLKCLWAHLHVVGTLRFYVLSYKLNELARPLLFCSWCLFLSLRFFQLYFPTITCFLTHP